MRRIVSLLVVTGMAASPVEGQLSRPQFGMGAGLAIPAGQFHSSFRGEGFGSGLQGMAFALFKIRQLPPSLRLEATYGFHGANDALKSDLQAAIGATSSEHVNLLGANLDLVYPSLSGRRAKLYALGGAGIYRATVSVNTNGANSGSGEFKVAWNAGGGLVIPLPSLSLMFESRFLRIAAPYGLPKMTVIPVMFGIRFGRNYVRPPRPPKPRAEPAPKKPAPALKPAAPGAPRPEPAAPTDNGRGEALYQWVGSMQNHIFFRATCDAAKSLPKNDQVFFDSEGAALMMGYKRSDAPGC